MTGVGASRAGLALACVVALASTAAADPGLVWAAAPSRGAPSTRVIAILTIGLQGLAQEVGDRFESTIETALEQRGFRVANRQVLSDRLSSSTRWSDGCVAGPCLSEVKTQAAADLVIAADLRATGTSFGFVVTLLRTDTGAVIAQESGRCEVCTQDESLLLATQTALRLVDRAPRELHDEAAVARAQARAPLESRLRRQHRLAITLGAVGVVATAVGAVLWSARDDRALAAGMFGAGAGLAGAGLLVIAF